MKTEAAVEKCLFGLRVTDWDKMPRGPEWTKYRTPNTHFVVRCRVVRFSDGTSQKYYVQRKRPTSRRELLALEREIEALKREVESVRRFHIVATDRLLLARKNARNGVRPRPRRKKAKR